MGREREKNYRVDHRDYNAGVQYEMQKGKSELAAKRDARANLKKHPTYYEVMPMAERIMEQREKTIKPLRKKRRLVISQYPPGFSSVPW